MKRKFLLIFSVIVCMQIIASAQPQEKDISRPGIWGIAKMTFYVSNFNLAREYYGNYLGFEEAFSYSSQKGTFLSFKINDRQFLEFIEDKDAEKKGFLASVSFECDSIRQMQAYLQSKHIGIIDEAGLDGAGNQTVSIQSTEPYLIEFIHYMPEGLHKQSEGNFLGGKRIAKKLHHAGLYVSDIEKADQLYREILGFKEMWRFREDNVSVPNYIYLHLPDCIENIEYIFNTDRNSSHPCFRVEDMQQTVYSLKNCLGEDNMPKPIIGKGNRWLLNLINNDGARVEFTEPYTVR